MDNRIKQAEATRKALDEYGVLHLKSSVPGQARSLIPKLQKRDQAASRLEDFIASVTGEMDLDAFDDALIKQGRGR